MAHYGKFHEGWAIVYDDGRVIAHSDLSGTGWSDSMYERRLTADGLDGVRSGAVPASAFVHEFSPGNALSYWEPFPPSGELPPGFAATPKLPADTWADPEFNTYVASRYAACYWQRANPIDRTRDATDVVGRLPAAAQALVRGKERTYNNYNIAFGDPVAPVECSDLSTKEAHALEKMLQDGGFGAGQAKIFVALNPILPHGEWVFWAG